MSARLLNTIILVVVGGALVFANGAWLGRFGASYTRKGTKEVCRLDGNRLDWTNQFNLAAAITGLPAENATAGGGGRLSAAIGYATIGS